MTDISGRTWTWWFRAYHRLSKSVWIFMNHACKVTRMFYELPMTRPVGIYKALMVLYLLGSLYSCDKLPRESKSRYPTLPQISGIGNGNGIEWINRLRRRNRLSWLFTSVIYTHSIQQCRPNQPKVQQIHQCTRSQYPNDRPMDHYTRRSFSRYYSILVRLELIQLRYWLYHFFWFLSMVDDGLKGLLGGLKMAMDDFVGSDILPHSWPTYHLPLEPFRAKRDEIKRRYSENSPALTQ